jgi:hypothetical protein
MKSMKVETDNEDADSALPPLAVTCTNEINFVDRFGELTKRGLGQRKKYPKRAKKSSVIVPRLPLLFFLLFGCSREMDIKLASDFTY